MEHYQFFGIEPRDLYFASQINHTEYCMVTFQIDPKIKYRNCMYVCVCVFFLPPTILIWLQRWWWCESAVVVDEEQQKKKIQTINLHHTTTTTTTVSIIFLNPQHTSFLLYSIFRLSTLPLVFTINSRAYILGLTQPKDPIPGITGWNRLYCFQS